MKAVLSNRIYLQVDPHQLRELDKELTYKIPNPMKERPDIIIKNLTRISDSLVSIPIGRQDLIPANYEVKDKRILAPTEIPEFKGVLRVSQQKIYDQLNDSAIINAAVSWGKTFAGLALAYKFSQKTLIVTHNLGIRQQWVEEIQKLFGFTPDIIGSGLFNTGTPIVVGNTQTLYKVSQKVAKLFGLVIMDEVHHLPAKTFTKVLDASYARYKIGLSGTIRRKDGKHVVFQDYFNKGSLFQPKRENYMKPEVHIIRTNIWFPGGSLPWALRLNELVQMPEYKLLVLVLADIYAKKGHKVLALSDRVAFLKSCGEELKDSSVVITGETEYQERAKAKNTLKEKDIIFGTQVIFSEGISINPLSCLILAAPVNNEPLLEQLIGRIVRLAPEKKTPIIVDIWLKGKTVDRQARARLGHYMRQGYRITYFDA